MLGDDSKLPRWYGRWDYGFWKMTKKEKKKHPSRDNHAVYVERYDRRHGRVWLMDPLAHGALERRVDQHLGAAQVRLEQRRRRCTWP